MLPEVDQDTAGCSLKVDGARMNAARKVSGHSWMQFESGYGTEEPRQKVIGTQFDAVGKWRKTG